MNIVYFYFSYFIVVHQNLGYSYYFFYEYYFVFFFELITILIQLIQSVIFKLSCYDIVNRKINLMNKINSITFKRTFSNIFHLWVPLELRGKMLRSRRRPGIVVSLIKSRQYNAVSKRTPLNYCYGH